MRTAGSNGCVVAGPPGGAAEPSPPAHAAAPINHVMASINNRNRAMTGFYRRVQAIMPTRRSRAARRSGGNVRRREVECFEKRSRHARLRDARSR
jgi:hypothetical protein